MSAGEKVPPKCGVVGCDKWATEVEICEHEKLGIGRGYYCGRGDHHSHANQFGEVLPVNRGYELLQEEIATLTASLAEARDKALYDAIDVIRKTDRKMRRAGYLCDAAKCIEAVQSLRAAALAAKGAT